MQAVNVLIQPFDKAAQVRRLIYVADAPGPEWYGLDGKNWEPAISVRPEMSIELMDPELSGKVQAGQAKLSLMLSQVRTVDRPELLYWTGAAITIWTTDDCHWSRRVLEFDGIVKAATIDRLNGSLSLSCEVDTTLIDKPLLTKSFTGGGGILGDAAKRGVLMPAGFGYCKNVEPVWFDETDNIGMIDGYGNTVSIDWLGEGLDDRGPKIADYPTYAALKAAIVAKAVPPGRWASCVAEGLVGLGAPPASGLSITVHAQFGSNRLGLWMKRMLTLHAGVAAGLIGASFDALDAAVNYPIHFHASDQKRILDLLQAAAASANATPLVTFQRKIEVTRAVRTAPVATLDYSGSVEPRVTKFRTVESPPPYHFMQARTARPVTVTPRENVLYEDQLEDKGLYRPDETYRQGHTVWKTTGSQWLYINPLPSMGNAPPADTVLENAFWRRLQGARQYPDGTPIDVLQPAQPGADVTGENTSADTGAVGGRPAATVLTQLDTTTYSLEQVIIDIEDLQEVYGDTGGAEAARIAAEAARDAALQAVEDAEAQVSAATAEKAAAVAAASAALSHRDAAGTHAQAAQASAVTATTRRDEAAGHASAAFTSSQTAGAHETAAGQHAAAADQSRVDAQAANATAAGHASAANSSAVVAGSHATAAQQSFTLTAAIALNAINRNPTFQDWPGGSGTAPAGWNEWSSISGAVRGVGQNGLGYSYEHGSPAGGWAGIMQWGDTGGLKIEPNGWYVVEADVQLVAGSFQGSGIHMSQYNAGRSTSSLLLNLDFFAAAGAGTVGRTYRFRRLVKATLAGADNADIYAMTNWPGFGQALAAKTLRWFRAGFRAASEAEIQAGEAIPVLEATVSQHAGAITNLNGRTLAYLTQTVNAGAGTTAFLELRAEVSPGNVTSNVSIGATEVHIYSASEAGFKKALSVVGGNVLLNGGLNVGAFIRLGTGEGWPVALQARDFQVADGDVVSFGANVGNLPALHFHGNGDLSALGTGETYRLYAENLSATGFTARLKIVTASAPTNQFKNAVTNHGTNPTSRIEKAPTPDSGDGNYDIRIQAGMTIQNPSVGEPGLGQLEAIVWVRKAGSWSVAGSQLLSAEGGFNGGTTNVVWDDTYTMQLGSGVEAVGVSRGQVSGGTVGAGTAAIVSVAWQSPGAASTTRSATPNGQKSTVTVRPQ